LPIRFSQIQGPDAPTPSEKCGLIVGPGPFSLDRLLGRGLTWSAFRPARIIDQFYTWATRALEPAILLLMRLGVAAVVVAPVVTLPSELRGIGLFQASMLPGGVLVAIAGLLVVGAAIRPTALVFAGMIPLSGITMSMDDRLIILLLFLIMAAAGAGRLSFDRLLVRWARSVPDEHSDAEKDLPHVVVVGGGSAAPRPSGVCATRVAASPLSTDATIISSSPCCTRWQLQLCLPPK
jgi:hypothetical protein